ncbi:TPA: hypothetical protein ACHGR9_003547 [Escherichia coli]
MAGQQMMMYRGVEIPRPILNIDLHVAPEFTGRVVLYIESGKVKADRRLSNDGHICALDTVIEMARDMELRLQEVSGGTYRNKNS